MYVSLDLQSVRVCIDLWLAKWSEESEKMIHSDHSDNGGDIQYTATDSPPNITVIPKMHEVFIQEILIFKKNIFMNKYMESVYMCGTRGTLEIIRKPFNSSKVGILSSPAEVWVVPHGPLSIMSE